MNQVTLPLPSLQVVGLCLTAICLLAVLVRNWSTITTAVGKIRLPSGGNAETPTSDPRVCLMHKWDDFSEELLSLAEDREAAQAVLDQFGDKLVWPTIRKAKGAK